MEEMHTIPIIGLYCTDIGEYCPSMGYQARKLASFDIPTTDNTHQYQCITPSLYSYKYLRHFGCLYIQIGFFII